MSAQEYGCNYCKITFTGLKQDNPKDKAEVKCPRCGSANLEKFNSYADKLKFFSRFAFSGG